MPTRRPGRLAPARSSGSTLARSRRIHPAGPACSTSRPRAHAGRARSRVVSRREGQPRTPTYKVTSATTTATSRRPDFLRPDQRRREGEWAAKSCAAVAGPGFIIRSPCDLIACRACTAWATAGPSRTSAHCASPRERPTASAEAVGFEVRALHVNGPGGGGGGSDPVVREILAVQSVLLPRTVVDSQVEVERI